MSEVALIEPKKLEIISKSSKDEKGNQRKVNVYLSKVPAVAGRRIVTQYPMSGMPKIGNYEENEKLMYELLSYVAVELDTGVKILLNEKSLIDNHLCDAEMLLRVEKAMLEYNFSFFDLGEISASLKNIVQIAPEKISSILMDLLGQFSKAAKQHSENYKQSTH